MKIKWGKLLIDTVMIVTLPIWIGPALVLWLGFEVVTGFIDNYTE